MIHLRTGWIELGLEWEGRTVGRAAAIAVRSETMEERDSDAGSRRECHQERMLDGSTSNPIPYTYWLFAPSLNA